MTADSPARERPGLVGLIARHPAVAYFVIAYLGSWLIWSQFVLSADGSGWFSFHATYGINPTIAMASLFGPALAAVVVMYCAYGEAGIVDFFHRLIRWRVGWLWWLVVIVGFPIAGTIGAMLVPGVAGSYDANLVWPGITSYLPFFLYPALLAGGPLGEEIGWRGAGLPLLQQRFTPLTATLILGPLWAVWHAPIWVSNQWARPTLLNILAFIVWISAATVVYTWVFNNTGGSTLMAIILHTTMDVYPNAILFPAFPELAAYTSFGVMKGYLALVIGFGLAAIALIVATKGRLGLPAGVPTPGIPADGSARKSNQASAEGQA